MIINLSVEQRTQNFGDAFQLIVRIESWIVQNATALSTDGSGLSRRTRAEHVRLWAHLCFREIEEIDR